MRSPVGPYSAAMAATRAHHACAEWPYRFVVVEVVAAHDDVVTAIDSTTVHEQIAAAMSADVAHGDGREGLTGEGHGPE